MRILAIGGTGFIGQHVVRQLGAMGHEMAVLHRGHTNVDLPAETILGDRRDLAKLGLKADVVIDMILSSGPQAEALMDVFRGVAQRVVAASSIDVYRAYGILRGSEEGELEPTPLHEESPLRTRLHIFSAEETQNMQAIFPWFDRDYDKIPVEHAVLGDRALPGTILRLPMVYGPGDPLHRFRPLLRQMDENQATIGMEEGWAEWRSPRGYVENVAAAIALAAVAEQAAGRIYNVAEQPAFTECEWARDIAAEAGWSGELVVLPRAEMAPDQVPAGNSAQHLDADSGRIRRELGYTEPVATDEAIRRTIEWERKGS